MSVIITNMEMPDSCFACPIESSYDYGRCGITGNDSNAMERPADCPLANVEESKPSSQSHIPIVIAALERHLEEFSDSHGWDTTTILSLRIAIDTLKKGTDHGSTVYRFTNDCGEYKSAPACEGFKS